MIFAKHDRLRATVAKGLIIIFCSIIVFNQFVYITNPESEEGITAAVFTGVAVIFVLPLVLLSVAPAKAVSRRLIFLAIGLILLIALNELSKLGLDVTAPKLQG
jgi:hypothetical protein